MPLDDTGFSFSSPYQAMMIVPEKLIQYAAKHRLVNDCLMAARELFAHATRLDPEVIYVTSAPHVTVGHLINYYDRTCVIGHQFTFYSEDKPQAAEYRMMVTKPLFAGIYERAKMDFPQTLSSLMENQRPFYVISHWSLSDFALCPVDVAASRPQELLVLKPPSCEYRIEL